MTAGPGISTDFVLEEPPKHALWFEAGQAGCESTQQQVVVVSRAPTIAASLKLPKGLRLRVRAATPAPKVSADLSRLLRSIRWGKHGYSVGQVEHRSDRQSQLQLQEESGQLYSNYLSRTLSETESTDNNDFISGRGQFMNVWRYRVLGVTDQSGLNTWQRRYRAEFE